MLAELIKSLGEASRPATIRKHREDYNQYITDTQTTGADPMTFEEYLRSKGIDPDKLLTK